MIDKNKLSGKTRSIKATVPEEVAEYFEARLKQYGGSVSGHISKPLCAMAYGEIRDEMISSVPLHSLRP